MLQYLPVDQQKPDSHSCQLQHATRKINPSHRLRRPGMREKSQAQKTVGDHQVGPFS